MSRRALLLGTACACVGGVAALRGRRVAPAAAAPATTTTALTVPPTTLLVPIDEAATPASPASRLGRLPPLFPVDVEPRCDILDNFGDPRSGGRTHAGTDILTTKGQEVYAMVDGTLTLMVVAGSSQSGASLSGNLWQLTAANGTYYIYAHLDAFAPGLAKGSTVVAGQVLGWTGDTGNPGPGNYHLHFEIHPGGGAAVDPLPLLQVPSACTIT
jgi:murein DD-endopeptidase MepM/ murein hydrolase activator NlpD